MYSVLTGTLTTDTSIVRAYGHSSSGQGRYAYRIFKSPKPFPSQAMIATCVGKKGPCANTSAAVASPTKHHALDGMISRSEKATLKEKKN